MERGRIREAVTCEWHPKCAVAGGCQCRGKQKRRKRGRGDNLPLMWHNVKGVLCLAWHSAVILNPALGDLSPTNLLILIIITVIIIIMTVISATVNSLFGEYTVSREQGVILRRWKLSKYCWKEVDWVNHQWGFRLCIILCPNISQVSFSKWSWSNRTSHCLTAGTFRLTVPRLLFSLF